MTVKKISNSSQKPLVYYGLHIYEGLAGYAGEGSAGSESDTHMVLVLENTLRKMDTTFSGRPLFVDHTNESGDNHQFNEENADGWVMESFFNKCDGKHWVKFICVSDAAHEAIRKGWKLSNAYTVTESRESGEYNGVHYDQEVSSGEYQHLALVPNPRYAESRILTPEQFKIYNSEKEHELLQIANSKSKTREETPMFKIFKPSKRVELESDVVSQLKGTEITLEKSKKTITFETMVNGMDELLHAGGYANGEHKVKVGEEEMTVNDLVKKHMEMMAKNAESMDDDIDGEEDDVENEDDTDDKAKDEEIEKKKNDLEETKKNALAEKAKKKANFDKLANAGNEIAEDSSDEDFIDLDHNKLARGVSRYGSAK